MTTPDCLSAAFLLPFSGYDRVLEPSMFASLPPPLLSTCAFRQLLQKSLGSDLPRAPANVTVRVDAPPFSMCLDHRDHNCLDNA
jgi:hypothetical protein